MFNFIIIYEFIYCVALKYQENYHADIHHLQLNEDMKFCLFETCAASCHSAIRHSEMHLWSSGLVPT